MDPIRVDKYTLIKLENGGQYGFKIIEGWENNAGEFKANFCKREFKKGSGEKLMPVTIKLGTREVAIATLQMLLKELGAEEDYDPNYSNEPPF